MSSSSGQSLWLSSRLYRLLLAAYPPEFRREYGPHMAQVFRDCRRDAHRRYGTRGVIGLWLRTLGDLAATALAERISERRYWDMSSPKLVFWCGLASLAGGVMFMAVAPSSSGAVLFLALLLSLGGLVGLHARQAKQAGRLGRTGFGLGLVGHVVALAFCSSVAFTNVYESLPRAAVLTTFLSLGLGVLGVGLALLGLETLRAKVLPRWRGLPLILGMLLGALGLWLIPSITLLRQGLNPWESPNFQVYIAVFIGLTVLIGVGWTGLGLTLVGDTGEMTTQPPPASA